MERRVKELDPNPICRQDATQTRSRPRTSCVKQRLKPPLYEYTFNF